jgi:hypothetical protein
MINNKGEERTSDVCTPRKNKERLLETDLPLAVLLASSKTPEAIMVEYGPAS